MRGVRRDAILAHLWTSANALRRLHLTVRFWPASVLRPAVPRQQRSGALLAFLREEQDARGSGYSAARHSSATGAPVDEADIGQCDHYASSGSEHRPDSVLQGDERRPGEEQARQQRHPKPQSMPSSETPGDLVVRQRLVLTKNHIELRHVGPACSDCPATGARVGRSGLGRVLPSAGVVESTAAAAPASHGQESTANPPRNPPP